MTAPPSAVPACGLAPRRLAAMSTSAPSTDDVWLVVPLYNEGTVIADVVRDARRTFPNVVVVDDGSSDGGADAAAAAGASSCGTRSTSARARRCRPGSSTPGRCRRCGGWSPSTPTASTR